MHGRTVATAVLLAAVVWSGSCSAPPRLAASADGPAGACFGPTPPGWTAAAAARTARLPNGVRFGPAAVTGTAAFGQYNAPSASGIGRIALDTGAFTRVTTFAAGAAGVGAMAVEAPWLVWEQLDSPSNISDWSVHAWNLDTGSGVVLATSRLPGGGYPTGQQPLPVIRHSTVAWGQPVHGGNAPPVSELRVVRLPGRPARTLATGRISSPVFAGRYLLWGRIDDAGVYSFQAVDADTLEPVTLPPPLARPGSIGYLAGSDRYLAWSSQDTTRLTVWTVGSPQSRRFAAPDADHHYQFLQLAGDRLLWYNGATSSVLDLTTSGAFDTPGLISGSAQWIVQAKDDDATIKGAGTTSQVARIPTSATGYRCTAG